MSGADRLLNECRHKGAVLQPFSPRSGCDRILALGFPALAFIEAAGFERLQCLQIIFEAVEETHTL
jgi:hypothetical protein